MFPTNSLQQQFAGLEQVYVNHALGLAGLSTRHALTYAQD